MCVCYILETQVYNLLKKTRVGGMIKYIHILSLYKINFRFYKTKNIMGKMMSVKLRLITSFIPTFRTSPIPIDSNTLTSVSRISNSTVDLTFEMFIRLGTYVKGVEGGKKQKRFIHFRLRDSGSSLY